jgi:hypothetical protein
MNNISSRTKEERQKYKGSARSMLLAQDIVPDTQTFQVHKTVGSSGNVDPNTTNLYLRNLSPKVSTVYTFLKSWHRLISLPIYSDL